MSDFVRIATQPWGVVYEADEEGSVTVPDGTLCLLEPRGDYDAALYSDEGVTPFEDAFETDSLGTLPAWVKTGKLWLTVGARDPIEVEAVSGALPASIGGVPAQVPTSAEAGFTWVFDDATGAAILVPLPGGGSSAGPWQDLSPYLVGGIESYGLPDATDDTLGYWARFREVGDDVEFAGALINASASVSIVNLFTALPSDLRPFAEHEGVVFESYAASSLAGVAARWIMCASPSFAMRLRSSPAYYTSSPNFGGLPRNQAISLNGYRYSRSGDGFGG